jgi:hypothetical protein
MGMSSSLLTRHYLNINATVVGKYSLAKPAKRNRVYQDNFRFFDTMKHSDPRSPGSLLLNIPRGAQCPTTIKEVGHDSPPTATTQAMASRRLESHAVTSLMEPSQDSGDQKNTTATSTI